MDCEASMDHLLRVLLDPSAEPTDLPLSLLKTITNDFSDSEIIGRGGFAAVYKGILQNGTFIAVKKLFHNPDMDDEKFIKEVGCLMKAKHKNIVRYLGYCSDAPGKILNHEGRMILAEEPARLLCFEFLLKGSLHTYIHDVSEGLEWKTRYKIIKGICEGLHYLHQDIHIVHSDLKPANILLDENMVPKIADFGLARCFDGNQSRTVTISNVGGTLGYMAPESYAGVITFKSDIYSLGIIILEILTGRKGYCDIQNVLENWTNRFKTSRGGTWLEHVRVCAEIGLNCVDFDPVKRPMTGHIIERLADLEFRCGLIETDVSATQVLDVYPLNIWFPLETDKEVKYPVTIINRTDDFIGVCIKPTGVYVGSNNGHPYMWETWHGQDRRLLKKELKLSLFRRLEPHSSMSIFMVRRKLQQTPLDADKGMFDVVMVATKSKEELDRLSIEWDNFAAWGFLDRLRKAKQSGRVVHVATLRAAVTLDPAALLCQEVVVGQQIIQPAAPRREFACIICMDVHPTKSWLLLLGYSSGHVSIWKWKYETQCYKQERVMEFEVPCKQKFDLCAGIISVKFIAGEQWFAAGDFMGCVHVYAYPGTEKDKVKELQAARGAICYLAVYPKDTLLLTASKYGKSIKLWDWSRGWTCARIIDTHDVSGLTVGPRDTSTIATRHMTSRGGYNVKVWDIHSSSDIPIAKFESDILGFNFYTDGDQHFNFYTDGDQHFLTIHIRGTVEIWDLQTKKYAHTLLFPKDWPAEGNVRNIACHPTLPILAVILAAEGNVRNVTTIVLWDVRTYR